MVQINPSGNVSANIPETDDDKKKKPVKEDKPEQKPEPAVLEKDKINLSNIPKDNNTQGNVKLFDNEKVDSKPNGWPNSGASISAKRNL